MKCKQFTDLPWPGRAEGSGWEECNLNSTSQGGSAARWSIHADCVRSFKQETDPAVQGRAGLVRAAADVSDHVRGGLTGRRSTEAADMSGLHHACKRSWLPHRRLLKEVIQSRLD